MTWLPLRLHPGDDLRRALEATAAMHRLSAAMVVSGIGSLSTACIRYAGIERIERLEEALEIVSLAGSIAGNGAHLHVAVSRADGSVRAGHVAYGCIVRTTAEVLLARLEGWTFEREADASTGFDELVVLRQASDPTMS